MLAAALTFSATSRSFMPPSEHLGDDRSPRYCGLRRFPSVNLSTNHRCELRWDFGSDDLLDLQADPIALFDPDALRNSVPAPATWLCCCWAWFCCGSAHFG
jgi:hypothetical protein